MSMSFGLECKKSLHQPHQQYSNAVLVFNRRYLGDVCDTAGSHHCCAVAIVMARLDDPCFRLAHNHQVGSSPTCDVLGPGGRRDQKKQQQQPDESHGRELSACVVWFTTGPVP